MLFAGGAGVSPIAIYIFSDSIPSPLQGSFGSESSPGQACEPGAIIFHCCPN